MPGFASTPRFLLRLMHFPPRAAYALGLGPLIGRLVLLLTTTGRKSGKARVTPLQYEIIAGEVYLGAAFGQRADWLRNLQVNPRVDLRVKARRTAGTARIVADTGQIADYLAVRLQRHPKIVSAMLRGDGLREPFQRADLEQYARQIRLAVITPDHPLD